MKHANTLTQIKLKSLTILAAGSVFLSSCATTSFNAETPDELRTMNEARLTYAAGGALLGAGAGYLLSGNQSSADRNRNAILGGLAGAGAGTLFGQQQGENKVEEKRVAKTSEAQIRSDIAKSAKFNSALSSYNSRLSREITQLRSSRDKTKLATAKSQSKTALSQANSQLSTTRSYISASENSGGKARMQSKESDLRNHISKLEKNRAELEKISASPKI